MNFNKYVNKLLSEEYTYMYDEIVIDPVTFNKSKLDPYKYPSLSIDMNDVKNKIILYFEVEYKHSKLYQAGKMPPKSIDRTMDRLFNYFVSIWTSLLQTAKYLVNTEDGVDWSSVMGDTDPNTINNIIKKGKSGGFSEKVISINAIISTVHTEEILIGKFINQGGIDYEGGVWDTLDMMSDKNANRRYTYRWDKELDQEFGI